MKTILLILVLGANPGEVIDYHTVPMESLEQCHEIRQVISLFSHFGDDKRIAYCAEQ